MENKRSSVYNFDSDSDRRQILSVNTKQSEQSTKDNAHDTKSVCHLPKNSGNSGWGVNGTRLFGSFCCKFSGINGIPEKVAPFFWWKHPNRNLRSIYRFLVFITSSIPFAVFKAARPPSAPARLPRMQLVTSGTCLSQTEIPNRNFL